MATMERQTSVDDLLGGFWRLGQAGMGRTDSEAAFQEFLKRIPSTTNLAAAVAESSGQGAASSSLPAASSALPAAVLSDVVTSVGIPRVPSLELLRQLVQFPGPGTSAHQPQAPSVPPPIKAEVQPPAASAPTFRLAEAAEVLKATSVPPLPAPVALPAAPPLPAGYPLTGISPALQDLASLSAVGAAALQAVPAFSAQPNPLAAALTPAAAAAAALQLGQLGTLGARLTNTSSTAGGVSSDKDMDKVDQRRARRMLSNRESARRSRRRKQEHLSKLEEERNALEDERRDMENQMSMLERRNTSLEDENKRLKEENERLRDELRFLRTEITERKERNGYGGHYGGRGRLHADSDEEQPAKRHRHSDKSSSEEHPGMAASDLEMDRRPSRGAGGGADGTGGRGGAAPGGGGTGPNGGGAGMYGGKYGRGGSGGGGGGSGSNRDRFSERPRAEGPRHVGERVRGRDMREARDDGEEDD